MQDLEKHVCPLTPTAAPTNCGVEFDQYQSFSDVPLVKCPECGKNTLRKLFVPVGIIFKGKGFYATDNRSPSGQSNGPKEKKETASEKADSAAPVPAATEGSKTKTSPDKSGDKSGENSSKG
jgi:putative regulatory protein, FmdB family